MAHLKFQRVSVVTSCMGDDLESEVSTLGYGRVVPEDCSVEEVSASYLYVLSGGNRAKVRYD